MIELNEQETLRVARPGPKAPCPACGTPGDPHRFGEHFTTYDESAQGCGRVLKGPRSDSPPRRCPCPGFVLMIRVDWLRTPPALPEGS